jgi:hypothetical protein
VDREISFQNGSLIVCSNSDCQRTGSNMLDSNRCVIAASCNIMDDDVDNTESDANEV